MQVPVHGVSQQTLSAQLLVSHSVPAEQDSPFSFLQTPLTHVLVPEQAPAGLLSGPDAIGVHVPTVGAMAQDWHSPAHASLQQRPSMHPPGVPHMAHGGDLQSPWPHGAPCVFCRTHWPEELQK
jgi:hypothetical protein